MASSAGGGNPAHRGFPDRATPDPLHADPAFLVRQLGAAQWPDRRLRRSGQAARLDARLGTPLVSDLTAFLTARLDEDEAAALDAARDECAEWRPTYPNPGLYAGTTDITDEHLTVIARVGTPVATHVARHDPARVLREVAAKRSLVEDHTGQCCVNDTNCGEIAGYFDSESGDPCPVLLILAAIWGDHPDYREEWKP